MAMTRKQQLFTIEYLVDLNATQAAIRAGYAKKRAYAIGHENLSKPEIMAAINQAMTARAERVEMTADQVLARLVEIDQMDCMDIMNDDGTIKPISQWPKIWRQFVSGVDVSEIISGAGDDKQIVGVLKKIKWPDKLKNLEMIGRHVNVQAWKEKVEVEVTLTLAERLSRARQRAGDVNQGA